MKTTKQAIAFFYEHAGYSYRPDRETQEAGRRRCAKSLAQAEALASAAGVSFEWSLDGLTNREWTDNGPEYGTWQCISRLNGKVIASLCGVDFGPDKEPWDDPYRRVVQAELALEAENLLEP